MKMTFIVHVMPKGTVLDPQGKAIERAMGNLGFRGVAGVKAGKRFEITLEVEGEEEGGRVAREVAKTLLSNPVIENFEIERGEPWRG